MHTVIRIQELINVLYPLCCTILFYAILHLFFACTIHIREAHGISLFLNTIYYEPNPSAKSVDKMTKYSEKLVWNLNGSLVQVLEEWVRAKTVEVRLDERVAAERSEVRVALMRDISVLHGEMAGDRIELCRVYGEAANDQAVIAAQAEKLLALSLLPDKVR